MEYNSYNGDLSLPKGIILSNNERKDINNLIAGILSRYYSFNKYSQDEIIIGDKKVVPQTLSKAVNNRTLLSKLVSDPNNEIITGIQTKDDLINFIKNNLFDLFNYQGKYFDVVYNLLKNTSKKGTRIETKAFEIFKRGIKEVKGIDVEITSPTDEQDINGIDGIFIYNGSKFTIQVKPLARIIDIGDRKLNVFCDGMLKTLITDYLIVSNMEKTLIFRSKGIVVNDRYYIIPKINLVYSDETP